MILFVMKVVGVDSRRVAPGCAVVVEFYRGRSYREEEREVIERERGKLLREIRTPRVSRI